MYSQIGQNILGMYSRIERHGDRKTTGNWQFLGAPHFPKLPIAPCSVCHPVDPFGVGIINIYMNTSIRSPRETKGQPRAGVPPRGGGLCFSRASDAGIHADVDDSNAESIDVEVRDPNSTCGVPRRIRFRCIEKSKIQKCSE